MKVESGEYGRLRTLATAFALSALLGLLPAVETLGSDSRAPRVARKTPSRRPAKTGQKNLIFAVDGLSYEAFQAARARGLFKRFGVSGQHVAPYPSMSNPSWTEVIGTKQVFGPRQGNIRDIEARYFDPEAMRDVNDPRHVFNRQGSFYNYTRALDFYFNPFAETFMYFPQDRILDLEFEQLERSIEREFRGNHYVAYLSAVDATAHTQLNRLFPLLERLDRLFDRVLENLDRKGERVRGWIVSDHGNGGKFAEGAPEEYLDVTTLESSAARAGLRIVEGELKADDEIAVPILALGSYAPVYFRDFSRRSAFAEAALENPAVDLVTWLEVGPDGARHVEIRGGDGQHARLRWNAAGYVYEALRGNPLRIPEELVTRGAPRVVPDEAMFEATRRGPYPDAPYRIRMSAEKQVENAPDLIVNLKRGWSFDGPLTKIVRMVRTHGSLGAEASLGLLAATSGRVPEQVRSADIRKVIGVEAMDLFHRMHDLVRVPPVQRLAEVRAQAATGIPTRMDDLSGEMLFLRQNKALAATMDIVSERDASDLMRGVLAAKARAASSDASGFRRKLEEAGRLLRDFDPLEIPRNFDALFDLKRLATDADRADGESLLRRIELHLAGIPGLKPLVDAKALLTEGDERAPRDFPAYAEAIRRITMKLWTLPYLVNETLTLPEFETTPETRDLGFADRWFRGQRDQVRMRPYRLKSTPGLANRLFGEVFAERKLWGSIMPATVPLLYNEAPAEITAVFVPGIYNELFDREIFSRGLRALRERLGLRVLYADVDGRCASGLNADRLLAILKDDFRRRVERGHAPPRYLILGYSKGGVDATEMLLKDPDFARQRVAGLVSIASPHLGTRIVEIADLPAVVSEGAVRRPLPAECRDADARDSLLPSTRQAFWARNLSALAGLTRYYSLSFESGVENAHPWMKLTKAIARFKTPNDGVVAVASSKFPEALDAVDFGTVPGDHLAGILASSFPQAAFLEAILLTLHEIDAFSTRNLREWYRESERSSPALQARHHRRAAAALILAATAKQGLAVDAVAIPADPAEDAEWYAEFARGDARADVALRPIPADALDRAARRIRDALQDTPYRTLPFRLEPGADGKLRLRIRVVDAPFYQFWREDKEETHEIATLRELVEVLLARGLARPIPALAHTGLDTRDFPVSTRKALALPASTWDRPEDSTIDLMALPKTLSRVTVDPLDPRARPEGVRIEFDHLSMRDFRREHHFHYESRSPGGMDDNLITGYAPVLSASEAGEKLVAMRMRNKNNSIRLTTFAYRFRPTDFPKLRATFKVVRAIPGADPAKGAGNVNDSPFMIWFMVRSLRGVDDRARVSASGTDVKLFGYYWGDERAAGTRPPGDLLEAAWSRRNLVVATLPEAWQMVLMSGKPNEGRWVETERDLAQDLARAFPGIPVDQLEVVGLTLASDSDSLGVDSEAHFRQLLITP